MSEEASVRTPNHRRGGWPPLPVLIVCAALLLAGARLALIGVARLAGWRDVLRDFEHELDRAWPAMLEHFVTPTGASILWTLCGGLCLAALLGLWTRRAWGRRLTTLLLVLALVWHALDLSVVTELSIPEFLDGALGLVFASALLALLHDRTVGAWLSPQPENP
jgi:hypothetical protein